MALSDKSVLKKLSFALIICGAVLTVTGFVALSAFHHLPAWASTVFLSGIAVLFAGMILRVIQMIREKNPALGTTLISLGLSAACGSGAYSLLLHAFTDSRRNPIAYPASGVALFVSFFAAVVLFVCYIPTRINRPSLKGILLDVLLAVIYVIPFFVLFGEFESLLSSLMHMILRD